MIEIIPAIDIIDGKCVRLTQGDYDTKTVYGDPVDMAMAFEDTGCRRLHVVDLDGAKSRHVVNISALRKITSRTRLTVDFGGGVKTDEDIEAAFDAGARMVTAGSVAVTSPETVSAWVSRYGAERIILGADVREGKIAINGWHETTGEDLHAFIRRNKATGITHVLCTDISRDGTLASPRIDLYKSVMRAFPDLYLIVSGGIASADDIRRLDAAGMPAVVFGKAFYEGKITSEDIKTLVREGKGR